MNNFTIKGSWWLPSNYDEKLYGQLIFEKDKGATLELMSGFKRMSIDTRQLYHYDIILGLSIDGKHVTLHNCAVSKLSFYTLGKLGNILLDVQYVFIGTHFNNKEEMRFSKLIGSFSQLEEWSGMNGFNIELKGDKCLNVEYNLPEQITAETDKFTIMITPSLCPPSYPYKEEITLKQNTNLVIKFKEETSFYNILDCCYHFQRALTLATMEPSSIQELKVSCIPSENAHGSKESEVFFSNNQTNRKQLSP